MNGAGPQCCWTTGIKVLDLLKASQGVETYLAEDLEADNTRMVVKILRSGVAALVLRLEHEAVEWAL